MKTELPIARLLRWRLSQAEAEAPPAPRAAHLLEPARPWWENRPEQFQLLVSRLGRIQVPQGHGTTELRDSLGGLPLPVLIALTNQEVATLARIIHLNVRNGRLVFRFQLDQLEAVATEAPTHFEATFVADQSGRPLLSAPAALSVDMKYRIDAELPTELAQDWEQLKAIDRMPFRLLLRSDTEVG